MMICLTQVIKNPAEAGFLMCFSCSVLFAVLAIIRCRSSLLIRDGLIPAPVLCRLPALRLQEPYYAATAFAPIGHYRCVV